MPMQKARLHRLMRITAELKENRYPNSESLVKEFRRMALEEGIEIDCGKKTILRDMKVLEEEFNCPLAYDRARNGYYLKHHGWDFIAPALLDENEMLASVIGARISESIFPPPIKNRIREAVDYLLGNISERIIEPHTMVFYNNAWYTKGFCKLKKEPRTFALHRIRKAELLTSVFTPDDAIIESINPDEFLGFEKVRDVKLKVGTMTLDRLNAAPLHSQQELGADGIVMIPAVTKEVLFPFLFSSRGDAVLLEPEDLRAELKNELQTMLKDY